MRALRLVAIGLWVAMIVLAGSWSTRPLSAQSSSAKQWCLSFHEVHPSLTVREARQRGVPAGYRIYPPANGRDQEQLLREEPVLHGGEVADAQAGVGQGLNLPIVSFRFNEAGARKFASFTSGNVGRPFAIVVGGRVASAPVIRMPILDGQGQIGGIVTEAEAEQLAARIRSGTCAEVSRLPAAWNVIAG